MSTLQLRAYDMLKLKLGENEAKLFIEYIETKVEAQVEHDTKQLATKEDLMVVKQDLMTVKEDLLKEINSVNRTVFAVGLIQFLAIVGAVIAIITFMLHK